MCFQQQGMANPIAYTIDGSSNIPYQAVQQSPLETQQQQLVLQSQPAPPPVCQPPMQGLANTAYQIIPPQQVQGSQTPPQQQQQPQPAPVVVPLSQGQQGDYACTPCPTSCPTPEGKGTCVYPRLMYRSGGTVLLLEAAGIGIASKGTGMWLNLVGV